MILIGSAKHVRMINCNLKNRDFSLAKNIIETQDAINQIKLMHKPNSTKEILIVVDNSGEIDAITIDLIKDKSKKSKLDKYEVVKTQKYNPKIDYEDNSPWSVDCQYPYIIIGSNNRTVFVFNYEDEENNAQEINNLNNNNILNNNSVIYKGNNNNIPYVTISDNGSFIGNNSIDNSFKIFDFYTGDLICSCINPNSEWGWGVKFVPQNLFKIRDHNFKTMEKRKEDNVICNVLMSLKMSDLNLTNPSQFDENNYNTIPYEDLNTYEKYIKLNLIDKYYILSTTNHSAGLFKLDYKIENNKKKVIAVSLGKIELNRNYIRDLYMESQQLDYLSLIMAKGINQCSRYEFLFYSKNMNLFLFGSKAGDLHVVEMNIYHDKKNKLIGMEDESNVIISFGEKIAGMKFIENNDGSGRKIIDIFVLSLSGMFYYYKIMPEFNSLNIYNN